ncbi:MAG: hypothetical protein CMJ26_01275 [Phycisphaerae bacterium]|nr:hypothetical protein [Phycisphaerae bacterium]|tara:strand:- start:5846 stop:6535 length:690 start_codon:yes stop_codon:yes gene_type:complete
MRLLFRTLIFIVLASIVQSGFGYPKATDRAERWQLRLDTNDLRYYRDKKTGDGYWVLVYEVTNETEKDRNWTPNFVLATDRGELLSDGENVPRQVQLSILDTFGDALMVAPSDASGPLLQGDAYAIRSFIVWKAGDEHIPGYQPLREIQVFASGVSGDTAEVTHPITGEKKRLRRVLQFSWFVDGNYDSILLKPLPQRPVDGGTSALRLSTDEKDSIGGDTVTRKWIFR